MRQSLLSIVRRIALAAFAIAILLAGATYLFGPHASVAAAYAAYKSAYAVRDGARVSRMTAEENLSFFETQRHLALTAPREVVAALPFRDRVGVLALRSQVLNGILPQNVLSNPSTTLAYADYISHLPANAPALPGSVLFAVPTGQTSVRGYLDLTSGSGSTLADGALAVFWDAYVDFRETPDGWKVDTTPIVQSSAAENEHWAVQMEPTGNAYIYQVLGASDALTQDRLWQPLQQ